MAPKKQKWNESLIVESSKQIFSLLEKVHSENFGEDESKESIIEKLQMFAAQNNKHLKDVGHFSFKGLLTAIEIEYCAKIACIRKGAKESTWQHIFETDPHIFAFVKASVLSEINSAQLDASGLCAAVNQLKSKPLTDSNAMKMNKSKLAMFYVESPTELSSEDAEETRSTASQSTTKYAVKDFIGLNEDDLSNLQLSLLKALSVYKVYPYAVYKGGEVVEQWIPGRHVCAVEAGKRAESATVQPAKSENECEAPHEEQ